MSTLTWMVELSWTLERSPIRIRFTSPRATTLNHRLACSPSSTSPITVAVGARNAVSGITGGVTRGGAGSA